MMSIIVPPASPTSAIMAATFLNFPSSVSSAEITELPYTVSSESREVNLVQYAYVSKVQKVNTARLPFNTADERLRRDQEGLQEVFDLLLLDRSEDLNRLRVKVTLKETTLLAPAFSVTKKGCRRAQTDSDV